MTSGISVPLCVAFRSTLFSLLNTDNPLLSPRNPRCSWLKQPTARFLLLAALWPQESPLLIFEKLDAELNETWRNSSLVASEQPAKDAGDLPTIQGQKSTTKLLVSWYDVYLDTSTTLKLSHDLVVLSPLFFNCYYILTVREQCTLYFTNCVRQL